MEFSGAARTIVRRRATSMATAGLIWQSTARRPACGTSSSRTVATPVRSLANGVARATSRSFADCAAAAIGAQARDGLGTRYDPNGLASLPTSPIRSLSMLQEIERRFMSLTQNLTQLQRRKLTNPIQNRDSIK